MFSEVCVSVIMFAGEGMMSLSVWSHIPSRGVWSQGVSASAGCLVPGGTLLPVMTSSASQYSG